MTTEGSPQPSTEYREVQEERFPPKVAILDFGGQYTELIKQACERSGVPAIIVTPGTQVSELSGTTIEAIMVSGSYEDVNSSDATVIDPEIFDDPEIPVLGICYAAQQMAVHFGGEVGRRDYSQSAVTKAGIDIKHPLFTGLRPDFKALFTQQCFIENPGEGVDVIAEYTNDEGDQVISGIAKGKKMAVQFHPEALDRTSRGLEVFSNFFNKIANIEPNQEFIDTRMEVFVEQAIAEIRERVGDGKVYLSFSGGVDSATVLALLHRALDPSQIIAEYYRNGFTRKEDDEVIEQFNAMGYNIRTLDVAEFFENATAQNSSGDVIGPLIEATEAEDKRLIIGNAFVRVFREETAQQYGLNPDEVVYALGTNAADNVESTRIKTHHNKVEAVKELDPLELLGHLFKGEIRMLAEYLGLPDNVVNRKPFPGPGTSLDILCLTEEMVVEHSPEALEKVSVEIGHINQELALDLGGELLQIRSVGSEGDERTYKHPLILTGFIPGEYIEYIVDKLTGRLKDYCNRVVIEIEPGQITEFEPIYPTHTTKENRNLQEGLYQTAREVMDEFGASEHISQMPVVTLPVGKDGRKVVVLRPVQTEDYMAATALLPDVHLPVELFRELRRRILEKHPEIINVMLDATDKPPGTIQWE